MLKYWLKVATIYGLVAFGFSGIGLIIYDTCDGCYDQSGNTIFNEVLFVHILGHISFGLMLAFPLLKFRYIITGGIFAIILDADHLLHFILTVLKNQFLWDVTDNTVPRMGHSILFGILVGVILLILFRKDIALAVVGFSAIFSHMAFDTITGGSGFPLLTPFSSQVYKFPPESWMYFFGIGLICTIGIKLYIRHKNHKVRWQYQ